MEYTLIRSRRKSLSLEVTLTGEVILRAPMACPQSDIDSFLSDHADWLKKAMARQQQRREAHPELSTEEQDVLRKKAKEILPKKVAHWSAVMELCPAAVTITGARTRFGSCSGKNRLSLSWRLMQYPEAAIDYVVVHELAHIVHKNHSDSFYALIEEYLPDYRDREKLLKG